MKKLMSKIKSVAVAALTMGLALGAQAEPDYLTFTSKGAFSVMLERTMYGDHSESGGPTVNLEYSTDKINWSPYVQNTVYNAAKSGDDYVLYLRGTDNTTFAEESDDFYYSRFKITGNAVACSGNVETLLDYTVVAAGEHPQMGDYTFNGLFEHCAALTSAPELPATELARDCYNCMFYGCTSLTNAPALPATELAKFCYADMFYGCTALTAAPALPATTLAYGCYNCMFMGCTSLTETPALPATELAECCYNSMFAWCTSLTVVPTLPVTNLKENCYSYMFGECTSIVVNEGKPGKAWSIPSEAAASAATATEWNADMFAGTGGTFKGAPEVGKTYYVASMPDYLTFTAEEDGSTIAFNWVSGTDVMINTNGTWEAYTAGTTITLANVGDKVMFKGKDVTTGEDEEEDLCNFTMTTGKIAASGDVGTLTDGKGGADVTLADDCYYSMFFDCTSLTAAPALPATTLAERCYTFMFAGCTSLTNAPALPAETLTEECYGTMFLGCTSLMAAPALPATTLACSCYSGMFSGCTSLTAAPELPVTTLAQGCYTYMFLGCTSLTNAPALPATTLVPWCYDSMFSGCTSLTNAPALPAKTLAEACYIYMFLGCTSLTNAPALPAKTLVPRCYREMFAGCTALTNAPALPATELTDYCYYGMFQGCTSLVVNEGMPGKKWSIPSEAAASAQTASNWNKDMFYGTGGTFTGGPEVGKTYYVGAKKETVGDATLYRYEDKVGVSVAGELTKEIADTLSDKAITNLVIGTGVTKIGASAFASWRTLRDVEIGANCVEVGALAFGKCHNVTNIACAATGTITIGNNAFVGCNSLETLSFGTMPDWGETPFLFYSGIYMKDGIPEVYAMPTVTITGFTQVLKGSNDLKSWENVDTTTPEGKAKYHFFKIALEAVK